MKKKIIYLVSLDSFFISHRLPIAEQLLKNGYEVHIATEFTNYKKKLSRMGFKTHNIKFNRNSLNPLKAIFSIFQIFILFNKIKPNIVHLISLKPIIFGGLVSFISSINSLVVSITGLGSMFIKKGVLFKIRENIFNKFYKIIFSFPRIQVILQNKDDLNYLMKKTYLKKNKVKIIKGSGIKIDKFKFSQIPKNTPIILMASRLIADKGVLEYIDSIRYLKKIKFKARFYLIGDIDFENPSAINKLIIDHCKKEKILIHFKHQKNIFKFIKKSTILVLPSYREGFPKILMEAASSGRPVITTNTPGCKDAVVNNITGVLVPVKNSLALAKAIKYLCSDKNKLQSMGRAARKHAVKNFDVMDVVSKHISIYKSLSKKFD